MTALTGVPQLVRFVLRRDRIYLPVWILSIVLLTYASAAAVRRTYDTPVEIASYAINVGGSPASVAMAGPPIALTQIGGILVYETSLTVLLGVALMAIFAVVRHTRAEEDSGRVELLGSTVVSPHAVITAAVLVAAAASVVVGGGVTLSFLAEQQPVKESLLYGASVAAMGIVFTCLAACAAQVVSHARSAIGLSLAFLALAFALRAIGDVQESGWTWLSPMGWSQQVSAYDLNRWWPLALSLGLAVLLLVGTVLFEGRRDLGAGVVPARPGPAEAGPRLAGVVGLAWRLQRGSVLGWSVGTFTMGLLLGSFSESITNMVEDNPTLADYFGTMGAKDVVEAFLATSLLLLALGAAGFAVSSALRTRAEETGGRLEAVLATGVSRTRWLFGSLLVTLLGTLVAVLVGGLGVGISYSMTGGTTSEIGRMAGLSLAYAPATLLLAAVAVLLVGWAPRASGLAWAGVAVSFVISWLGGLLGLAGWVEDVSPFTHVPAVPSVDLAVTPLLVLGLLSAAAVALGYAGFLRRDVG